MMVIFYLEILWLWVLLKPGASPGFLKDVSYAAVTCASVALRLAPSGVGPSNRITGDSGFYWMRPSLVLVAILAATADVVRMKHEE